MANLASDRAVGPPHPSGGILPVAAKEDIDAIPTMHDIEAIATVDSIATGATGDAIGACSSQHHVCSAGAFEPVLPAICHKRRRFPTV